jgi:tripartite-type tricarboxylate transporter receptor subunit TctC
MRPQRPKPTIPSGQKVIVENKPGASGAIALQAAALAKPDGYTLVLVPSTSLIHSPLLMKNSKLFDPVKSFRPIIKVGRLSNLIVAKNSFPANSFPELIAIARSKPETVAAGNVSNTTRILLAKLKESTGATFLDIAYPGGAQMTQALLGGHVDIMFDAIGLAKAQVEAGAYKVLVNLGPVRSTKFPDVPTVSEFVPGFDSSAWFGISGPANLPQPIVTKLNRALDAVLDRPDVRAIMDQSFDMQRFENVPPDVLSREIAAEYAQVRQLVEKYDLAQ